MNLTLYLIIFRELMNFTLYLIIFRELMNITLYLIIFRELMNFTLYLIIFRELIYELYCATQALTHAPYPRRPIHQQSTPHIICSSPMETGLSGTKWITSAYPYI
jgi:hypothetical protein